jgi:putative addiction module component (TIGR02574 family)
MPTTVDELLAAALALSPAERQELSDRLSDHVGPPPGADDAVGAELDRRAEEARRDPSVLIPWDQVREMR